jgi:hypothetical protein
LLAPVIPGVTAACAAPITRFLIVWVSSRSGK